MKAYDHTKEHNMQDLQELQQKYDLLKATFEKGLNDKEKEKLILEKLITVSEEFIQFSDHTPDYAKILQIVLDISGAKYAVLNIFEDNGLDFTTVAIAGINENIKKASSFLGFDIVNKHWKHDPVREEKTRQNTITRFEHLHDLTGTALSKSITGLIEKVFNIKEAFIVKTVKNDLVLGDFTLLFKTGETLTNHSLVDLYAHQVGLFLDRNRITKSLQESSRKFEAIISASPNGIGVVSLDGKIQLMSKKLALMFGYSSNEIDENIGKSLFGFIEPSNHKLLIDNIKLLVADEKDYQVTEYLAIKKDASRFYIDVNSAVLFDSTGKPESILFVARDITERKQIEKKLRDSESKYRLLIDNTNESIAVAQDGMFKFVNPVMLELLSGYSEQELLSKPFSEFIHPDDRSLVVESYQNRIASKEVPQRYSFRLIARNNVVKWVEINAALIEWEGKPATLNFLTDITKRKKTEEELNQASTRLSLAARASGVGVWELDLVNDTLLWDDEMFELYGVDKRSSIGTYETWKAGVHPEDVAQGDKEVQMALSGEKEFDTEFRVVWSDASIHNIRALATVQHDDSGKPLRMIGTNWDITEQKKTEAVLLKARQEAEMANKAKSIFLANMSHEIRTPLNAIIGFSQLMNRDKHLSETQREYSTSIIRAGEHLLTLINDILELSKVEAGRVELNPTNFDLHPFLTDLQMIFKERTESKNLQFIFETAEDLPRYVVTDESKLRQIFINLIGNAVKFTDEGGIAVRTRMDKTNLDTFHLIVEIQDSGPGIPDNELGNLFMHFVQTSSGIKNGSGTGLGLALSRELAILLGGNITVSSEVGKGSVFTFNVEIKEGEPEPAETEVSRRVICIDKGETTYRILVVDDKEENLKVAVNLLRMVGFETNEAVNGEDAIEKFEDWNPDLILMDMRMPVMDGYEATRCIKLTEKGRQTPIIALTASAFEDEQQKAKAYGMQGYIRKPFRENDLYGIIGKILDIKYIYEGETPGSQTKYLNNDQVVAADIARLPDRLVIKMEDALADADINQLKKIIKSIDPEHAGIAQLLMTLAQNYDYDYLQKILSQKEENNEQ